MRGWGRLEAPGVVSVGELERPMDQGGLNGNFNATPAIAPDKYYMWLFAADVIWHF